MPEQMQSNPDTPQRDIIASLALARLSDLPDAESIAGELLLLVEGAIVLAVTRADAKPARDARAAARRMLGIGR
jgi:hypothetical protein